MSPVLKVLNTYKLTFLTIGVIMVLSLIKTEGMDTPSLLAFEGVDKVIHLLMYAGLTLIYLVEHSRLFSKKRDYRPVKIYSVIWIMALGGFLELAQPIIGGRTRDWQDFLANCSGVILVYFTYRLSLNFWRKPKDMSSMK